MLGHHLAVEADHGPVGVMEQARRLKGSLFAFLARIPSTFPHTITRYVDLIAFARRRFPEQYAKFEAANPGIPADLDDLSGERTSSASMAKGVFAISGYYAALVMTLVIWVLAGGWLLGHMANVFGRSAMAPTPALSSTDLLSSDTTATTTTPSAAQQGSAPQ